MMESRSYLVHFLQGIVELNIELESARIFGRNTSTSSLTWYTRTSK
jgi:hypothetical protein